ncbi:MAG: phosphoribosylaminoimidazolesuccinocarboxamide synthase [Acidobacteriota bacterium]
MTDLLWQTDLPALGAPQRGKVRDVYDLGDTALLVACDRISAYDHVLRPGIPGRGKVLNQLTIWWMERLADLVPHHLLATDPADFPAELAPYADQLRGRAVLVKTCRVIPFECVARGYLAGSAYREYQSDGSVCGITLPRGLKRASRLPEPVFTPATKAASGHDENVDFRTMAQAVGDDVALEMRRLTLELYARGQAHAEACGLILADTKFELGRDPEHEGVLDLVLIDEVMTPDSSRYWQADAWSPGTEPESFDKQFVRNWLDEGGWDHESTPPELSRDVVEGTLERYIEAFRRLTGAEPAL